MVSLYFNTLEFKCDMTRTFDVSSIMVVNLFDIKIKIGVCKRNFVLIRSQVFKFASVILYWVYYCIVQSEKFERM